MPQNVVDPAKDETSQRPSPVKPIGWGIAVGALLCIAVAFVLSYLWLSAAIPTHHSNDPAFVLEVSKMRAEARRNALATAGGIAALGALMLAFRRQRHSEHQQLYHEYEFTRTQMTSERDHLQRERVAKASEEDALQRRITDARIRAVEQLGSNNPTVRVGGLHNLERIGGQHKELRQVVLDEVCSYLRLPHAPQSPESNKPLDRKQFEPIGPPPPETSSTIPEREVRLIAQEILQRHLNPNSEIDFWEHSRLNLKNAFLEGLILKDCRLTGADFSGAIFAGDSNFNAATFASEATFSGATFSGNTAFREVKFTERANFTNAKFVEDVDFRAACFSGEADFGRTAFAKSTSFETVAFQAWTDFQGSTFEEVSFNNLSFPGFVNFSEAKFAKRVLFKYTNFNQSPIFSGAEFSGIALFVRALFSKGANFTSAHFNSSTDFTDADFGGTLSARRSQLAAILENQGVRFQMSSHHELPERWSLEPIPGDGTWGWLIRDGADG